MAIAKPGESEKPPLGALILLSVILPGAGHLAVGEKAKGWVFVGVSIVLLIGFFVQLALIIPPILGATAEGRPPEIDDAFVSQIRRLLVILGVALAVWVVAVADIIISGKRRAG